MCVEIHQRLSAQYGDSVLPQQNVYEWTDMFKNAWTSVTDEKQSGRPSKSTTEVNTEHVHARTNSWQEGDFQWSGKPTAD